MTTKSTSRNGESEERSAGFVLFRGEGEGRRYLLLRHRNGGHWGFPKGGIEEGEDELAAARREIREETGIVDFRPIPGFRAISRYRFYRNGREIDKTVVYFLGSVGSGEVQVSAEHSAGGWFSPAEAERTLTYEQGRKILAEAEEYLARGISGSSD